MGKKHTEETFWRRINTGESHCCWLWSGKPVKDGYGRLKYHSKNILAHRLAYSLYNKIELANMVGLDVMHSCDNPLCCNPHHLTLGTHQDNLDDMVRKSRSSKNKGSGNSHAKVTEDIVRQIRQLYATKEYTQKQIGVIVGLKQPTVGKIIQGLYWSHVV